MRVGLEKSGFIVCLMGMQASLVAQLVKNSPAMWEIPVRSLGWEDPLEKRRATHSSILTWRIPWTVYPWGRKELDTTKHLSLHFSGCKLRRSRAGCLAKKLPILWGGMVRSGGLSGPRGIRRMGAALGLSCMRGKKEG